MGRLQSQPLEYTEELWHRYGDLVRLSVMPGFNIIVVIHPDHIEHVLSTHAERYGKADFFLNAMGAVQGRGLFTSEGEFWRSHRQSEQQLGRSMPTFLGEQDRTFALAKTLR